MSKIIIIATVITAIAIAPIIFFIFFSGYSPDLEKYAHLKDPQINTMPRQKMIIVVAKGDPNVVGKKALRALFKIFYKLKGKEKGLKHVAPRARFPKPFDTPKNEWINIYGLPIPESVETLPGQKKGDISGVKIEYWEYGKVAEILHIGPYNKETPTIEKLHKFIKDKGYKIVGAHEEEYLKGPGMIFKGDPNKYWTIIRYRIEKGLE